MPNHNNILIIENSTAFTGAFKSIRTISEYLKKDFSFCYCIPLRSNLESLLKDSGFLSLKMPFLEIGRSTKAVIFYFPFLIINSMRIHHFCKENNISIIHVNDMFNMCGVVLKMFSRSYTVIYHIRLLPDSYVGPLYFVWIRMIAKWTDSAICVSEAVRKGVGSSITKSVVIHDALPEQERHPEKNPNNWNSCKLLYLANFTPGKGQDLAIQSFLLATRSLPSATLTFVGSDLGLTGNQQYKARLVQSVMELGMEDRVSFGEFVEDTEQLIKSYDILLNFSESESFSMTCLEGLMYGTPVIASDSGGPAELILSDKTGILVRNRDIHEMSEAIVRLCNDNQLRERLSKEGRRYVQEKYSLSAAAIKLSDIYQSATTEYHGYN